MPRCARIKGPENMYHIMCRSISEILLFQDEEDKDYYLNLLVRYKEKYRCSIYGYCLMDTHLHLHFDPKGVDISQIMHSLNTAYVRYYNKKYDRHGHVFQERFASKVIESEAHSLAVSAYIHNNPSDIQEYYGKEETYKYSSYGIFLGIRKDYKKIIDKSHILSLFGEKEEVFIKRYAEFVTHHREIGCLKKSIEEIKLERKNEYRSERKTIIRSHIPAKIIAYISNKIVGERNILQSKKRVQKEFRSFCAYVLRVLCGLKFREICGHLYNIGLSGCSVMCDRGYELSISNKRYKKIFNELMELRDIA